MSLFDQLLEEKGYLLADGATGTNLFDLGLTSGDAPELWNVDQPETISGLVQSFVEAGSDIVLTNTFGGNRHRLKLHHAQDRVAELNIAAAEIVRAVVDGLDRPVIVAGSIGPTGELIEPLGELSYQGAVEAFTEQAIALADGGVDILWLETLSSKEELAAAAEGAANAGLPFACTLSFDTNGNTMMGITPIQLAEICAEVNPRPSAFGSNCGVGPAEVVAGMLLMSSNACASMPMVAKANCGIPEFRDGAIRYDGTPELMADYAVMARAAGARIIGGCCGTTAAHVKVMRKALDENPLAGKPTVDDIEQRLGSISAGSRAGCLGHKHAPAASAGSRGSRRGRRKIAVS